MTVKLPADVEEELRSRVASGRFENEADVIRAALRRLDEAERADWLEQTLAEGEEGERVELTPELFVRLRREAEENAINGVPVDDAVRP